MDRPTEQQLVDTFAGICERRGLRVRKPEGLRVPYFTSEFNRLMEHRELNRMVNTEFDLLSEKGWYQNTVAARTNDMRKVDAGWHATVFEMLIEAVAYPPAHVREAYKQTTHHVKEFLVDSLGLDTRNIVVTHFGGGEVLPSVRIEDDGVLRECWSAIGISAANVIPVHGPKNYVLMAGEQERCGPTSEILYRCSLPDGTMKAVEIGTVIVHSHRIRHHPNEHAWSIERAPTTVTGVAYGLGRLLCAIHQRNLADTPVLDSLLRIIHSYVVQPVDAHPLLRSDEIVLADQLKAVMFLIACGIKPGESPQGKLVETIIRRARRKIAALHITEWSAMLGEFESAVLRQYECRYPALRSVSGGLMTLLARVEWPTGWNPDSYDPTRV